jgi:hypothetical protein
MTLSTVDFDSRSDALTAAEYAGYDVSSVSISVDHDSGRYQWNLRSFDVALDADGETPSGADAAADVVADMVAGLGDALDDAPVVTDISVPAGWSSVEGGIVIEPLTADSTFSIARAVAQVDVPPVAVDVPAKPVDASPIAGDLIMQVFTAMPAASFGNFAQAFADKHMAIVTLRDAVTFAVVSVVTPGMGKVKRAGGSGASVSGASSGGSVTRAPVEREETLIDRIKRGVWLDSEVSVTNLSILKLKHAIEAAAGAGDMELLASLGGFKSTSTYYNHARAYLEFHLADAPVRAAEREAKRAAEQAALDAEFGFGALAA